MATQVEKKTTNEPKKLKQADITKASNEHFYIKVGVTKDGHKQGTLVISGAVNRWNKPEGKNKNEIYAPQVRCVGTADEIRQALKATGATDENINQIILNSYTASNYETAPYKERFNAELELYEAYRKTVPKASKETTQKENKFELDDLSNLWQKASDPQSNTPGKPIQTQPKKGGGRGKKTLSATLDGFNKVDPDTEGNDKNKDKVVDVTPYFTKQTWKVITRKPESKSKKTLVPGLRIVSDNFESYEKALQLLSTETGNNYDSYIAKFKEMSTLIVQPVSIETLPKPTIPIPAPTLMGAGKLPTFGE